MTGNRRGGRLAAALPLAWVRHQFPRQVAWGGRRLDPRTPLGFWLTFTVSVGALAALAFGGITQDVVGHHEAAELDPHVTAWVAAHRIDWLTIVIKVATWLGPTAVIVPLAVIVGVFFMLCRHRWWPMAFLAAAIGDLDRPFLRCGVSVGARDAVSRLLLGARHHSGFRTASGREGSAVERSRVRRAGRGRVTYLPGSSLADRRSGWLALGASWVAVITTVALVTWQPYMLFRSGSGSTGSMRSAS